ncbi:MAG TPA: DUF551 domain-containing protein [Sediminibacterium sp.]|nr:DUF551 domain-containing protein [Sediminibacterium sp.]
MNLKPETIEAIEKLRVALVNENAILTHTASCDIRLGMELLMENHQEILALEGYHKTEWVSVGDRLPAKNGPCYVWDNGPYEAGFYNGKFKTLEKCVSGVLSDFRADINPTHWMPLPPAPNTKP